MSSTTIISKNVFEPVAKAGQAFRIEPLRSYGYYVLPDSQAVEVLPPVTINMATPFSAQLAAFSTTGNQTPIATEVSDLDMNTLELAQYRLYAVDNVLFQINQPAGTGKMTNKNGPVRFGIETQSFFENGMWSMLPELWVFGDNETRPTINVVNASFTPTYYARFKAFGFKYKLQKLKNIANPALTVRVEAD